MAAAPAPYSTPALLTLKAQIDEAYPDRPTASDGWLGDTAHQARKSDHNPDPDGSVDARDFTDWPAKNLAENVTDALVRSRDPRIKYVIWNGRIVKSYTDGAGRPPWVWQTYTGPSPHTKHFHISGTDAGENDTNPWIITYNPFHHKPENTDMTPEQEAKLDRLLLLAEEQEADYGKTGKSMRQIILETKAATERIEKRLAP